MADNAQCVTDCCLAMTLAVLLLVAASPALVAGGVWTTDCRLLATQRLDPIVYPGYRSHQQIFLE